jgi:hypothetical protein
MPTRNLKVFYYTLNLPDDTTHDEFESFVAELLDGSQEDRTVRMNGIQHRIRRVPCLGEGYKLAVARERTGNWPYWMRDDAGNEFDRVPLQSGTLGEVSFFWLLPQRNLMLEIYNHYGPSQATFREYITRQGVNQGRPLTGFSFRAIFERDQYARFLRVTRAQKIQFKVNIANAPQEVIDEEVGGRNLNQALSLLGQDSGGMDVDITVSVGRGSSLSVEGIRSWVSSLRNSEDTKTLKVRGAEGEDDRPEFINLLEGRLEFPRSIHIDDNYLATNEYVQLFNEAYATHQGYLAEHA